MNTAFMLVALTTLVAGEASSTPTWNASYVQAQEQAAGKKPLAVVFGSGQDGWTKLVRSADSKLLLSEQYVCVYVDTATEAGKKLAASFAINNANGVVLSNRTGTVQAFWHDGELADASLVRSLRKFGDPTVVVTTTERDAVSRVSYYPSGDGAVQGTATSPVMRSSCPNGNCPYVR